MRLHARGLGGSHGENAALLLSRVALLELAAPVLARAREPFPSAVRTLDALHLASAHFSRFAKEGTCSRDSGYVAKLVS